MVPDALAPLDFETFTGTPEEVRTRLEFTDAEQVVALTVPHGARSAIRVLAETMTALAPLVPAIVARRQQAAVETIIEALVPSVPPAEPMLVEARMVAEARRVVLEGAAWLTAAQVAELAGFSASNPSAQPSKWKRDGAVFAIRHQGTDYYPGYALDPDHGYRPFKCLSRILSVFGDRKDAWRLAYWFGSVNSALGGARPCDVLAREPNRVVAAARDEVEGPVHG